MFELVVEGGKINLSTAGSVLERSDEEETTLTFKAYEPYLLKVLSLKGKEIIVNWLEIENIKKAADYRRREAIGQYINAVLLTLGILTRDPREAYFFYDNEMNPVWGVPDAEYSSWRVNTLYFTRKEDALACKKESWIVQLVHF